MIDFLIIFGSMYIKIRFDAPLELEERPEPFSFGKNHRSTTSFYSHQYGGSNFISYNIFLLKKFQKRLKIH